MPWIPESDPMGTHTQMENFSHTVQYYTIEIIPGSVDPETGAAGESTEIRTYYPVVITPNDPNPASITINNTGSTSGSTISGFYGSIFNDQVYAMKNDFTYVYLDTMTTPPIGEGVWTKLEDYDIKEMVYFIPDPSRTRTFTYTCVANGESTTKSVVCQDLSWEPGKNALRAAVAATRV